MRSSYQSRSREDASYLMTYGTLYNLLYNNEVLYKCLTEEELGEVLQDYADRFFSDRENNIDPDKIDVQPQRR